MREITQRSDYLQRHTESGDQNIIFIHTTLLHRKISQTIT